jgi:hypothetical protein
MISAGKAKAVASDRLMRIEFLLIDVFACTTAPPA